MLNRRFFSRLCEARIQIGRLENQTKEFLRKSFLRQYSKNREKSRILRYCLDIQSLRRVNFMFNPSSERLTKQSEKSVLNLTFPFDFSAEINGGFVFGIRSQSVENGYPAKQFLI